MLYNDFPLFAEKVLKIRSKAGQIVPLELNKSQLYIHSRLEDQLKRTGRVRALILKGRQLGASTYTEARFFWKVTHKFGVRAYILTHLDEASTNLFGMAKRFWENAPEPLRPSIKASNAKELIFDKLDSSYRIGTAGSKSIGRSDTLQFFHGSEVAYWPNAAEHVSGIMQAVPDVEGSEIILESTSAGPVGSFYDLCMQSLQGKSEYEVIFVPWYWVDEYQAPLREGFKIDYDEYPLVEQFGLTPQQIAWRRKKIAELGGDEARFKREYPNTVEEAFLASSADNQLINGMIVDDAVKRVIPLHQMEYAPVIIGVDPARFGSDSSVIMRRQGLVAFEPIAYKGLDNMALAARVATEIDIHKPDAVFIDAGNGSGVIDRLRQMGHDVVEVNFGGSARDTERFLNMRAEMWWHMREWLPNASITNTPRLRADLVAPTFSYNAKQQIKLESKDDMKARGLPSSDYADSLCLTFAAPVVKKQRYNNTPVSKYKDPLDPRTYVDNKRRAEWDFRNV